MPWNVDKTGFCPSSRPYGVFKEGEKRPRWCHSSRARAMSQVRALYAQESRKSFSSALRSFLSLFGQEEDPYRLIVKNNRTGPAMKRENNIDYPAKDYAYVPDPQRPATWRLRLTEAPGKISLRMLARAAAAIARRSIDGVPLDIPPAAMASVRRRIRQEYRKLGVPDNQIPQSVREEGDYGMAQHFAVQKDLNGNYRWFAIYSNNAQDDDGRPEIVSSASHKSFVSLVDKGLMPAPKLRLWHTPLDIGEADMVDFTGTVAVASGTFYKEYESVAEKLMQYNEPLGASLYSPFAIRDDDNPDVIVFSPVEEISILPLDQAANLYTSVYVSRKGQQEMISEQKQRFLKALLPDEEFNSLMESVKSMEEAVANSGKVQKDAEEAEPEEVQQQVDSDEIRKQVEEEVLKVAQVIAEAVKKSVDEVKREIAGLAQRIEAVEESAKSANEKAEDVRRAVAPRESAESIIAKMFSSESAVSEDDSLAKSKPQETKETPPIGGSTLLATLINGSRANAR